MKQPSRLDQRYRQLAASMMIAGNLWGCAANVNAVMPGPRVASAGQVAIRFNHPTYHVLATVNGFVVADDAHTQSIIVNNVPPGPANVQIAMGGRGLDATTLESKVMVPPNGAVAVAVAAPNVSIAHAVAMTGLLIFEGIVLAALLVTAHGNRERDHGNHDRTHGATP